MRTNIDERFMSDRYYTNRQTPEVFTLRCGSQPDSVFVRSSQSRARDHKLLIGTHHGLWSTQNRHRDPAACNTLKSAPCASLVPPVSSFILLLFRGRGGAATWANPRGALPISSPIPDRLFGKSSCSGPPATAILLTSAFPRWPPI